MGQNASQPEQASDAPMSRRRSLLRRSATVPSVGVTDAQGDSEDGAPYNEAQHRPRSPSPGGNHRLSQLFRRASTRLVTSQSAPERPRRSDLIQRTRSTLRDMLGRDTFGRRTSERHSRSDHTPGTSTLPYQSSHARINHEGDLGDHFFIPRLPSIELTSSFDNDPFVHSDEVEALSAPPSSHRRSNLRFNPLRHDRPFRHFASSLRRRRSTQVSESVRGNVGSEDQAAMLSRLLSVAAAATAATLMGDDHQALSEAQSLTGGTGIGDLGGAGEDGSFDGFLRALQNGRIASALRQGNETEASQEGPLNFFRMFRFGSSVSPASDTIHSAGLGDPSEANDGGEGRMVPIIIVGIRSIIPGSGSSSSSPDGLPPFIDALGNFPSPLPAHALGAHGHDSIDSILRPPQNGTSFRHRRRASMGGFGMGRSRISDRLDDQRDHRSPDRRRERPWSVASSSSNNEPRPPPVTPASPSPELSRISSANGTPNHSRPASIVANGIRDLGDSRRNSVLHRLAGASALSAHSEETVSLRSSHSSDNLLSQQSDADAFRLQTHRRSDTAPDVHFPRFASGHPRRNGVVEPDNLRPLSRSSTSNATDAEERSSANDSRSWIIYVLGGSYPENHPLLTTPSLFTENPTYEDMMLLSALLGPARAPVATDEDVQSAGGIYNIQASSDMERAVDAAKTALLVAEATDRTERVELELGQRCLVCLCDFEIDEVARKLVKCNHLFHKECIDQVSKTRLCQVAYHNSY
nr:putative ring finger protein p4h10.07 [Quercus suber]